VKAKSVFIVSLLLTIFLAACATTSAAPEPETGPEGSPPESEFDPIYDKFEGRLILDGAGKYIVQPGDMLSAITRGQYGSTNGLYFPLIMLASSDIVSDPDLIEPGMELIVPDLQRNLEDANARQALKEFLREIAGVYQRKGTIEPTRVGMLELSNSL
jgi:hypothetical protein